jgi:hypothetical protein
MRKTAMLTFVSALSAGGLVLVEACVGDEPVTVPNTTKDAASGDGATALDAANASDAGAARCDLAKDFAAPMPLLELPWQRGDFQSSASLTADEKTLYFCQGNPNTDIFVATRSDGAAPFGQPKRVSELSGDSAETHVGVALDGKTIFFSRALTQGIRLHFATSSSGVFGNLGVIEFPDASAISPFQRIDDFTPSVRGDLLYFSSQGRSSGSSDIFKVSIPYASVKPSDVAELNTNQYRDEHPVLSADGLQIYFASSRPPSQSVDVWQASRNAPGDNFLPPKIVPALSSAEEDFPTWLSPDGCTIYLSRQVIMSDQPGYRIFVARRPL